MKLRVLDNSIRLRLTQQEVSAAGSGHKVAGNVEFGGGMVFRYQLEPSASCAEPVADFASGVMTVRLPQSTVSAWAGSDRVSISGRQALPGGRELDLLVEKDFKCLSPRPGEDESDMFANPLEGREAC
ncbi:MAG: DUF7009 family protein [Woeseiaceae bacterium]